MLLRAQAAAGFHRPKHAIRNTLCIQLMYCLLARAVHMQPTALLAVRQCRLSKSQADRSGLVTKPTRQAFTMCAGAGAGTQQRCVNVLTMKRPSCGSLGLRAELSKACVPQVFL
jgi:hypothetical protein